MADDEQIFKGKDEEVDWQVMLELRDKDFLEKLHKADAGNEEKKLDEFVKELEGQFEHISRYKINKEDARADVDNLIHLFEVTQALLEVKAMQLDGEVDAHKATKAKTKKLREEVNEQGERITEQDNLIEELQRDMKASFGGPRKGGDGGPADSVQFRRMEAELNSTQKKLESVSEDLNQTKRSLDTEREKALDANARANKENLESTRLAQEVKELTEEIENMRQRQAEEEKKSRKTRAQAQKTTKEAYRFVREITELSNTNEQLEQELKAVKEELELVTNDSLHIKDQLEETQVLLQNTERMKEELEQDMQVLREKVAEMTLREDEREEEHEQLMQEITTKVRALKSELNETHANLDAREQELREATVTIKKLEQEKRQSEVERRMQEADEKITRLENEKAEQVEQYIQAQKENKMLKDQVMKAAEDEKKQLKQLQAYYRGRENEVRASFFERQEEMADAERRVTEMSHRMAEMEETNMELEQHITNVEEGHFRLPEATAKIKEQKRELEALHNRLSSKTKDHNEALRKIEDLHEEVLLLRDRVKSFDKNLEKKLGAGGAFKGGLEFVEVSEEDKNGPLDWGRGYRLDISAYKVKTAMELEKAKAVTLQLEREVEALEVERLEMKSQLRHMSMLRGERAAKLGMSATEIEKLDAYAEQLKSGQDGPPIEGGLSQGDKTRMRKMTERIEKQDKELKETKKDLSTALETIEKLNEDIKNREALHETINQLQSMQRSFATTNYQQQLRQQQRQGSDAAPRRRQSQEEEEQPVMPALPLLGLGTAGMGEFIKAFREADLGEQPMVEVTIISAKVAAGASVYAAVTVLPLPGQRGSKFTQSMAGPNPQFNDTFTLPVAQRDTDVLSIRLYEAPREGQKRDEDKDLLIGKMEIKIQSWARVSDSDSQRGVRWTGHVSQQWQDLKDAHGDVVRVEDERGGSRINAQLRLSLTFRETARRKVELLERDLESERGMNALTKESLDSKTREAEGLREDLKRKVEDLDHVIQERNKLRDDAQRARMNGALGGLQMPVIATNADGTAEQPELAEAYTKLLEDFSDHNRFLIQALDDLSKREHELAAVQEEVQRYKEDMDVLRVQQVLLYKEHTGKVGGLDSELNKITKAWSEEKKMREVESSKVTKANLLLDEMRAPDKTPNEERRLRLEAERRLIVLQAEQDVAERQVEITREEEKDLRDRYDALVVEMARQEHRLKQRIGRLDRARWAADRRLQECQQQLGRSVPKEELTKLREEHLQLKERYASTVNRESKEMLEKAAEAGFRSKAERLDKDNHELKLQLAEATDRAAALTSRLEFLALQDGPPEQQLLAALSDKLVKLEVSERNAVRRSELALERMRGMETDSTRLQDRIHVLEEESVENAARIHELEERDRDLRTRLDGSISAKEATELRTKVSEQEFELAELKINVSKFQEIADLATDQAKAMEELHAVHLEELQAMRTYVSQVQAESDEQAEHGLLQRKLMDKQRQVHELTSKVAAMDRELVRLDEYIVRLEDTLERKAETLHKQSDQADTQIKNLERTVDDLRGKTAGQIPLEKADQWAASLRELTEQKQLAAEELSAAQKEKRESDDKAEALQIQLEHLEDVVKQLKASEGDEGRMGQADKLIGQAEEVTRLKLENLRLTRQAKQLQEREFHLEQVVQAAEKEVRRVEEQLVVAEQLREQEVDAQELKSQVEKLKARVQELESERGGFRGSPGKFGRGGYFSSGGTPGGPGGGGGAAKLLGDLGKGGGLGAAEGRAVDQEAIIAMQEEVNRLLNELQEKEKEVEELNKQLDESMGRRGDGTGGGRGDTAGAEEAAEHTQQVARLTIDRLEKNNKRKTDLISRYQKQLQEAREEYVKQKETDNAKIATLTEQLATKTHESIQTMRQRTTTQTIVDPSTFQSPTAVAEADQLFAEKDQAIRDLTKELQKLKSQLDELKEQKEDVDDKLKSKNEEVEKLTTQITKAEGRKPSQVLETLVFKLKKQLAEKEKKQEEMKNAIEKLGKQMEEAAELQARTEMAAMAAGGSGGAEAEAAVVEQVARAKQQADMLDGKLKKARSELSSLKTQLDAEKGRVEELTKKKESLDDTVRKQGVELSAAKKRAKDAQDSLKKLEAEAAKDGKRIGELESELRKAQRKAEDGGGGAGGGGGGAAGGSRPRRGEGEGREGEREEATRRWEAEKRLEAKVERLTGKLRDQRKELEAMEKQHASEKDKMGKEMDKLKERIDFLEDAKKQLKAKLRGEGPSMDSEEVLMRVREAERKNLELEEQNERLRSELEVASKAKDNVHKTTTEGLQNTIRELKEDLKAKDEALAAQDEEAGAREKVKEVRRLEGEVGKLRERVEELEGELLRSQNEVIRLTFETDHAELRLQRWRRRVRELEALPLAAVGKADPVDAGEKKAGAKSSGKARSREDEEQERFIRSTRAAMEKLHKENESLRANAATNVKYMDTLRELKTVRAALSDRDRELKTLNEKLTQAKSEAGKKASVDEENRKLKRQFNDEKARADHLGDELRDKERRISRLEAEVREARDALGGETAAGERMRAAGEEVEELRDELRKAKRELSDEKQKVTKLRTDLREEKERAENALAKFEDEVKRGAAAKSGPVGGGGASDRQVAELKEQVRKLQQENDDLRGELNSLDPAFFDEIEDLKYNHNEMAKLVDRYETLLQYLSEKYAFEFTPLGAPAARRSGRG